MTSYELLGISNKSGIKGRANFTANVLSRALHVKGMPPFYDFRMACHVPYLLGVRSASEQFARSQSYPSNLPFAANLDLKFSHPVAFFVGENGKPRSLARYVPFLAKDRPTGPESALSPQRQLALLALIHELVETGACQFIVASHSPILMTYPMAQIISFDKGTLEDVSLENTAHYQITRGILADPQRYWKYLTERA